MNRNGTGQQQRSTYATSNQIIQTSDLISWSLQIARGMDFLASKKVMDGIYCLIQ